MDEINNRIQGMVRSMDLWRSMVPVAVATGSMAQVEYALADAKTDIEVLWRKVAALSSAAVAEREPVAQFRKAGCSDWYDGLPDYQDGRGPYEERTLYLDPPPTSELEAENARLRAERDDFKDEWQAELEKRKEVQARLRATEARLAEALKALEPFADARMIARLEAENREGISNFGTACCVSVPTVIGCLYDARRVREGGKTDG